MTQILMIIMAAALAFVLVDLVGTLATKNQRAIDARMDELNGRQAKSTAKPSRKNKNKAKGPSRTSKELAKLEVELYDVGINISVYKFVAIWALVTVIVPGLLLSFGVHWVVSIVCVLAFAFGPILYLSLKRSKRRTELESQLVEAIGLLVNSLKAGHSFQAAMQSIAREMEGPVSEEFGRVFRETQHGMPLEESMELMNRRIGSPDLEMLCHAIAIQRQVGGNLADVLNNISATVQARLDLKAEIKTRTSSGRISGYIIGALPILLLVVMMVINPSYATMFFTTNIGHIALVAAAVLEIIGFFVISRIVAVKY